MEAVGDILIFNPATEFQVIEEFEFDELITRPEKLHFFTLTEQASDLFKNLLPKTTKIAKGTLKKVEREVDAFTKLHEEYLQETPIGYEVIEREKPTKLSWVNYAYNKEPKYTGFNWQKNWIPLFDSERSFQSNYYILLLDSLPKNGVYYPEGEGKVEYDALIKTSKGSSKVLGPYPFTRTGYKEDGSFRIQKILRPSTEDVATFTGYTIDVPNPAPPTPLENHPFLGLRTEPITIDSTESLSLLIPSTEAIFQHAVPRTTNPYRDAKSFMKIYDIRLKDVPWPIWKETFPPVELIGEGAPPLDLPLKTSQEDAPSKVLLDIYKTPWYPGYSTRKWLSSQIDGGLIISKILLSRVGTLAPIAIPPPVKLPEGASISGRAEDCLPSSIADFNDFSLLGVYRTYKCNVCGWYGHGASECPDAKGLQAKEYKNGGGCLPLVFIENERYELPFLNKQAWTPGLDASILKDYQSLIKNYTDKHIDIIAAVPKADPIQEISDVREFILGVLNDDTRVPEDKAIDILTLIHDTEFAIVNHTYTENGQFLICEHTLSELDGDFSKDSQTFLKKWTVNESGFRVCRYCGEKVSNIIEAQDEFDENGRLIQSRSAFMSKSFHSDDHLTFAASLKQLQTLLKLSEPSEDILYLLLSLIQVLPEETQLKPILDYCRTETAKIRTKLAGKNLTTKQKSDIDLALAVFGFNAVIILMQTHRPQLIPRRSFGNKPLILRGYPRDTTDSNDAPLVDGLMGALTQTFERYPSTFRGSSVVFLRTLLNDKKGLKKVILSSLAKQFVPVFKNNLIKSADVIQSVDVSYTLKNGFQPEIYRPKKDVTYLSPDSKLLDKEITLFRCKDVSPAWLVPSTPFSFRQNEIKIVDNIRPSSKAIRLEAVESKSLFYSPTSSEVREKARTKVPEFASLKRVLTIDTPQLLRSILLEWFLIVNSSKTVTDNIRRYIDEMTPKVEHSVGDPSLLRDYYKGILSELTNLFISDLTIASNIERSFQENLAIRSFMTKSSDAKKNIDILRAKEREEFKSRMRNMTDSQREITKELIDRGIAPYLITKTDRESFLKELQAELADLDVIQATVAVGEETKEEDVPDEGLNVERDIGAQGEVPESADGIELEADYGDYGDLRARTGDGEEYNESVPFDDQEGMGF